MKNNYRIIHELGGLEKFRRSLYFSAEKVQGWYLQMVSQVYGLKTKEELSGEVGAKFLELLEFKAGGKKGREAELAIDKEVVQAVVAEKVARALKKLTDLSSTPAKKGDLNYYFGPARVTIMNERVSPEATGLSDSACALITEERNSQEDILKIFDPEVRTIVLTFTAQGQDYASIGSTKTSNGTPLVNANWLSSYHKQQNFGILCTLESTQGPAVFLEPLWIWWSE